MTNFQIMEQVTLPFVEQPMSRHTS